MGSFISSFFFVPGCRPDRILILGLDNAGKTTLLHHLKLKKKPTEATIPTIGFNVEDITFKNMRITMWDIGGQSKIRPLWKHYYQNTVAICFVVDSTDVGRMIEAHDELLQVLAEPELLGVPVMIWANKCDLPNAAPLPVIAHHLGLFNIETPWYGLTTPPKGRPLAPAAETKGPRPWAPPTTLQLQAANASTTPAGATMILQFPPPATPAAAATTTTATIPISWSATSSTIEHKSVGSISTPSSSSSSSSSSSAAAVKTVDRVPRQNAREWHIISTNAINGDGIWAALDWTRLAILRFHRRYDT